MYFQLVCNCTEYENIKMIITRDIYLKRLISSRHNGFIKIITGIRRCGKSYLLSVLFSSWLKENGVDENHIITVNLEDRRCKNLRDPDKLLAHIDGKILDDNMYYVMIDEIQLVPEFEDVLNSYLGMSNVDVYVTGSNARFLSKDVITTFRGRGEEIRVFPLSFEEYLQTTNLSMPMALGNYMLYGGMPQVVLEADEKKKRTLLKSYFSNIYVRDIVERYKIRNTEALDEILNILASGIGGLTNPGKLTNTFESVKHEKISRPTMVSYLEYICDSFIAERAERYDIKGKRYIDSSYKYYFTDCGLRNARLNFRQVEFSHLMENVIYNELLLKGFSVDVGVVPIQRMDSEGNRTRTNLEVDFVCNEGSRRYYIQSAYRMPEENKLRQEEASLRNVDDSFKKIIILGEETPLLRTETGITIISIYDFLLKEDALDL